MDVMRRPAFRKRDDNALPTRRPLMAWEGPTPPTLGWAADDGFRALGLPYTTKTTMNEEGIDR
jgi:hypothetical protein